jgi:hypothetical protein
MKSNRDPEILTSINYPHQRSGWCNHQHGNTSYSMQIRSIAHHLMKLPREAHLIMLDIIHRYCNGIYDNPEWNQTLLGILYKKKRKQDDLNNYQGICLQDLVACYISSIISSRLLKMLEDHGIKEWLPTTLWLQICTVHSVLSTTTPTPAYPTYMGIVVDFVKQFDTDDQKPKFQILAKFGIPKSMIYVIRYLYDNIEIKILVGKQASKTQLESSKAMQWLQ